MFVLVKKKIDKSYSLPVQNDHEPPLGVCQFDYLAKYAYFASKMS